MMSAINSTLALIARLALNGRRYERRMLAALRERTFAAAVVRRLKDLAPYALIELILPGGSVMALLLWLYRRQKQKPGFAAHDEVVTLLSR
jgi:hypothetical protein